MKRGVSDETLNRMLKASYRHAALAYGTRDEEQIQCQLDDIAARAAAIEPREPEPAITPAGRRITVRAPASRSVLDRLLPATMVLASTAALAAVNFAGWRNVGIAVVIGAQIGTMTLAMVFRLFRSCETRAHRQGVSSSTGETPSRRTRSRA